MKQRRWQRPDHSRCVRMQITAGVYVCVCVCCSLHLPVKQRRWQRPDHSRGFPFSFFFSKSFCREGAERANDSLQTLPRSHDLRVGWARIIFVRCIYSIFGRGFHQIYGVYVRFWPTLLHKMRSTGRHSILHPSALLPNVASTHTHARKHIHTQARTHAHTQANSNPVVSPVPSPMKHAYTHMHANTYTHRHAHTHTHRSIPIL